MSRNETKIFGYDVLFPVGKRPFPPQLAVIAKVLKALRDKENALLESPTGTGKTLALLASTLAWQQEFILLCKNTTESSHTSSTGSALNCSTDIIESPTMKDNEAETSCTSSSANSNENESQQSPRSKLPTVPKIFFCSRTHSQLQQVVKELRSCHIDYISDIKMTILGSRSHYCINESAKASNSALNKTSVDENCRKLAITRSCRFSHSLVPLINTLSKNAVWDIEDAVQNGLKHKSCPYFSSREMISTANYIFAPYNYIIDQSIRSAMKINLKDAVVIFDEAHNIEDICRDAASAEISRIFMVNTVEQLTALAKTGAAAFTALLDFMSRLLKWVDNMTDTLSVEETYNSSSNSSSNKRSDNFMKDSNVWDGDEAVSIFQRDMGLSASMLDVCKQHLRDLVEQQEDIGMVVQRIQNGAEEVGEEDGSEEHAGRPQLDLTLSNSSLMVLKSLLGAFDYLYRNDCVHAPDYKVVITKSVNWTARNASVSNKRPQIDIIFNIWCLDASIVFSELDSSCRSIILTSGTLSPLGSFAGELNCSFPVRVEAGHVINLSTQVLVRAVSTCGDYSLVSTYSCQDSALYQDAVGNALRSIARVTPGGVLLFLPSYGLLNKLEQRWTDSGLLHNLQSEMGIAVYFEPRDAKNMVDTLSSYYSAIDNAGGSSSSSSDSNASGKAILVAVCRGKVSEGINFTDSYARAVMVLGIPYPSTMDEKIRLKKEYQTQKAAKNKIYADGDAWYRQQAFRAVNQAVGRCIRHKNDFGAIYLLDPRFAQENVASQMSKWIKNQLVSVNRLEDTLVELSLFYRRLLPVDSPYLRSSDGNANTITVSSSESSFSAPLNEAQKADSADMRADNRSSVSSAPPSTTIPSAKKGKRKGDTIAHGASIMEAFKKVPPAAESRKRDIEQVYEVDTIEDTAPKFDPQTPGNVFNFIISPRALAALQTISQQWKWDTTSQDSQDNCLGVLPDNLNYLRKGFEAYFPPSSVAVMPYPVATPLSIDSTNMPSLQSSVPSSSSSSSSNTDGIDLQDIVIQEFWDSADGVAYRTIHIASLKHNGDSKSDSEMSSPRSSAATTSFSGSSPDYLLVAAEIVATTKDQTNFVGKCYAHLDVFELVKGGLCFDDSSVPLTRESRSDSIGYL